MPQPRKSFVHLHVHDDESKFDGLSRKPDLARLADEFSTCDSDRALAETNHGWMGGYTAMYRECEKRGVKAIPGLEAYHVTPQTEEQMETGKPGNAIGKSAGGNNHLILLARNNEGLKNLYRLDTLAKTQYPSRARAPITDDDLGAFSEGLIVTSACLGSMVDQHLMAGDYKAALAQAAIHAEIVGKENYFIEIADHGIQEQSFVIPSLLKIATDLGVKVIATNDSHYTERKDAVLHDCYLCAGDGKHIYNPNRFKFAGTNNHFATPEYMHDLFPDSEFKNACSNTVMVAEMVDITLPKASDFQFPVYPLPSGLSEKQALRAMVETGLQEFYADDSGTVPQHVRDRAEYELSTIDAMGFNVYMLTVADVVQKVKKMGYRIAPGRGSAAGSLVSYSTRITSVDPLPHGLIFERFLNPGRVEMPDIDIDLETSARSVAIRVTSDLFGADKVAMIGTVGTMKAKGALTRAAKAYGRNTAGAKEVTSLWRDILPDFTLVEALSPDPIEGDRFDAWNSMRTMRDIYFPAKVIADRVDEACEIQDKMVVDLSDRADDAASTLVSATVYKDGEIDTPYRMAKAFNGIVSGLLNISMTQALLYETTDHSEPIPAGLMCENADPDRATDAWIKVLNWVMLTRESTEMARILDAAVAFEGGVQNFGTHASGVIISPKPLTDFTALRYDKDGDLVTQSDADAISSIGLVKMDYLGLRNLDVIATTVRYINKDLGIDLDIESVPLDDPRVYEALSRGETEGVFQVSGSGITRLLMDLKPTCFADISAVLALYRPGPMGMNSHVAYARRKNGLEDVVVLHPELKDILGDTYGLVVYQEQVMEIAQKFAGYSLAEADSFRKAIGKKKASVMAEQRKGFVDGVAKHHPGETVSLGGGRTQPVGEYLWDVIEPFAGYAFNKSHSVSYGYTTYWTMYLKAIYPAQYAAAAIDLVEDKVKKAAQIASARQLGVQIYGPDINNSSLRNRTSKDGDLWLGLSALTKPDVMEKIIEERQQNGKFSSLNDMANRCAATVDNMPASVIHSLAASGALDPITSSRKFVVDVAENFAKDIRDTFKKIDKFQREIEEDGDQDQDINELFGFDEVESRPKVRTNYDAMAKNSTDYGEIERRQSEFQALGFSVGQHLFEAVRPHLDALTEQGKLPQWHAASDSLPVGEMITVAGIISSVEPVTKAGKSRTSFVLDSSPFDAINGLLFGVKLPKSLSGTPVIARGRWDEDSYGEGGTFKFMAQDVQHVDLNNPSTELADALNENRNNTTRLATARNSSVVRQPRTSERMVRDSDSGVTVLGTHTAKQVAERRTVVKRRSDRARGVNVRFVIPIDLLSELNEELRIWRIPEEDLADLDSVPSMVSISSGGRDYLLDGKFLFDDGDLSWFSDKFPGCVCSRPSNLEWTAIERSAQ